MRYGAALKGLRDKIVLATKSRNRTWLQAEVDLNQSLQFLGTGHIDLYQVHNLMSEEEFGVMFGPRGIIELIEKAKRDGKIRFVGITCHGDPAVLVRALERYPFDTVLMPLSLTDGASPAQKSFEKTALPVARKKGMGIIAMKALGAGRILKQKTATEKECLEYVFSLPLSTAILGCTDSPQVERNAAVARAAKPLTAAAMEELRRRVSTQELALLEPWKRIENVEPVYRAD